LTPKNFNVNIFENTEKHRKMKTQIKVAIVEDQEEASNSLMDCLNAFSKENGIVFETRLFKEGFSFLDHDKDYDLIFMDVEMPGMNGIQVAEKLRNEDSDVALIFVTNMAQYAIQGYSVDAIDYVLKPIKYSRFSALMKKTLRIIDKNQENEIILKTGGGMKKLLLSSIYYIEISDHLLIYHTKDGDIDVWGTISGAEASLPAESFCRCSHSVIVSLKYVSSVVKDTIYLNNDNIKIAISHSKKKEFMSRYNRFVGF